MAPFWFAMISSLVSTELWMQLFIWLDEDDVIFIAFFSSKTNIRSFQLFSIFFLHLLKIWKWDLLQAVSLLLVKLWIIQDSLKISDYSIKLSFNELLVFFFCCGILNKPFDDCCKESKIWVLVRQWPKLIGKCVDILLDVVICVPRLLAKLWLLYCVDGCLLVVFWPMLSFWQYASAWLKCKLCLSVYSLPNFLKG